MTTIKLVNGDGVTGLPALYVNSRYIRLAHRIDTIKQTSKGRWTGTASGLPFEIEGGKHAGGSKSDWFVNCHNMTGLKVTSAVAAINLIETA